MSDKKAVSSVVATVFVILVTVAAISVIWVAVLPLVSVEVGTFDPKVSFEFINFGEYTFYDSVQKKVSVNIKRGNDDSNIDNLKVVLFNQGNTYPKIVDAPKQNQAIKYVFDLEKCSFEPEAISVAPIYLEKGMEKEGALIKEVYLPNKNGESYLSVIPFCE